MGPWPKNFAFQKHEFTNPDGMNLDFLRKLTSLRAAIGVPIYVNRGAETEGHAPNSAHYDRLCNAVDIQITGMNIKTQGRYIKAAGFAGVGLYPSWTRGGHLMPGWHLDDAHAIDGIRPRPWTWVGVKDYTGQMNYVPV